MEFVLAALNPATGTSLPIPLFIISGIVLVGIIAFTIVSNVLKKKKSGGKGRRRRK
ncbi:MAG: hypothetical protein J6O50_08535 [Ruminiclostridium sp.]|nr:hypothetical protein [Ruminiclostridium sp.]